MKPEIAPLDPNVYEVLAAFRLALRRFLSFSETLTANEGVTPQQYQAMLVVKTHADGPVMIRDIAEQMLLQPHGAVQLVDRLVAAGLVERAQSANDGRSVLVSLTIKGAAVLERLAAHHVKELMVLEPLFSESHRRLRTLRAISGPKQAGARARRKKNNASL